MLITVGNHVREVCLLKEDSNISFYQVGEAIVIWKFGQEEPCSVHLPEFNKHISQETLIRKVLPFLYEWKRALDGSNEFALCINAVNEHKITKSPKKDENRLSGVTQWMRDEKEWTACMHLQGPKTGEIAYYRRTRFKQDGDKGYNSKTFDLIVEYKSYCYKCNYRETCVKPCIDPCIKSSHDFAKPIIMAIGPVDEKVTSKKVTKQKPIKKKMGYLEKLRNKVLKEKEKCI